MTDRYLLIAVARSKEAAKLFDLNEESDSDIYKWELSIGDYDLLVKTNVFMKLNDQCGCLIDNYEDDKLCGYESLKRGMFVVGHIMNIESDNNKRLLLERLAGFFVLAFALDTCIYFYF